MKRFLSRKPGTGKASRPGPLSRRLTIGTVFARHRPSPSNAVRPMTTNGRVTRRRAGLFLLVVCCVLHGTVAHARFWLEPAVADGPPLGPAAALGAVIWSHGRSAESEDWTAPTPPYIVDLRDQGWDVFRFNRHRVEDTLTGSARALIDQVTRLKRQGYRRIALAGQSVGGFLALMAADASEDVDAVIVTAPAAYGTYAQSYDTWRKNATMLYPLFEQIRRARVMAFYFHGDDFDPGGRSERTRAILTDRGLPYVVVDQPAQLTTHWAATTRDFAELYGACVRDFLNAEKLGKGAHCLSAEFSPGSESAPPPLPAPGSVRVASGRRSEGR
jgi:dienelactone hydrolase